MARGTPWHRSGAGPHGNSPRPAYRVRTGALSLSLAFVAGAGCAANRHDQLVAFLRAHEQGVATGQYTVMPPDALEIHAAIAPEIDGVVSPIRPDGKIALRLLGEVDVAGLTTEQVADKLREHLSRYYVQPEVVVDVAHYASQFYYVFGQVDLPGPKAFTGRDTLLRALAQARPNFLAWRSQIHVVRPSAEADQRKVIIVDLDRMVSTGDIRTDVLLQPGDVIEVPPTPLAWLGLRVRELLFPVTPAVDVYQAPAHALDSTRIYEYEFGDQRDPSGRWQRRYP